MKEVHAADIFANLCELAPLECQMEFDNSGFQLGRPDSVVRRVLLSLDITGEVAEEAREKDVQLIVTHHPLLFHPVRSVTDMDPIQKIALMLIENGIALISMHTNLDVARGGVNDALLSLFGLQAHSCLDEDGCGRIGEFPDALDLSAFLEKCRSLLKTDGLRYYDAGRPVRRLAVMGGSGGDSLDRAASLGCDTYLTADVKYHQFLLAKELGINLIDGDHFCTENPIVPALAERLRSAFPSVAFMISERHMQTIRFC